jgi:hypothetical protein
VPIAAELEMQRERGQRVDVAKAAQAGDRRPPRLVGRQRGEPLAQSLLAGGQPIDRGELVRERQLGRRLVELLTSHVRCRCVQVDGSG